MKKFQNETFEHFLKEVADSEIPNINIFMTEILNHIQLKMNSKIKISNQSFKVCLHVIKTYDFSFNLVINIILKLK
jgi:hypothetical protein